MTVIIVLMGVSGAGKTSVGRLLAEQLGCEFAEGDDYHPSSNVAKMSAGLALDDADRWPWLQRLAEQIGHWARQERSAVLTCSALKRRYREVLACARPDLVFVYLKGAQALIDERLRQRRDHFMPASLLRSQFEALEEPSPEENAIIVEVTPPEEQIVAAIRRRLGQRLP